MNRFVKVPLYIGILFIVGMVAGASHIQDIELEQYGRGAQPEGKKRCRGCERASGKGPALTGCCRRLRFGYTCGYIVRQDIPAASDVKEGRGIKVVVSKGPKVQYVSGRCRHEAR